MRRNQIRYTNKRYQLLNIEINLKVIILSTFLDLVKLIYIRVTNSYSYLPLDYSEKNLICFLVESTEHK